MKTGKGCEGGRLFDHLNQGKFVWGKQFSEIAIISWTWFLKAVVVSSQSGLDWKSTLLRDMEANVNQQII